MLLKADPRLEGEGEGVKVCLQLNQKSGLQYFFETAGSMDHQHVLG